MGFISVYVTHPTEAVANKITDFLIRQRHIACANIYPITSSYWWKESVQMDKEWVSLLKTSTDKWEPLKAAIESVHPYDTPCIIKTEVVANAAYERWIESCVRPLSEE